MGTVYRRQVRFCTTCERRLDTTAARKACEASGHSIEIREQPVWWIKYQVNGRPVCVSSGRKTPDRADNSVSRALLGRPYWLGSPLPSHSHRQETDEK